MVLLDEPTSQIDNQSQQKVLSSLFKQAAEAHHASTVMMIAHRLETAVTYSDRILVMDQGMAKEYDSSFKLLVENSKEYLDSKYSEGEL